jgi:hypothetical protein
MDIEVKIRNNFDGALQLDTQVANSVRRFGLRGRGRTAVIQMPGVSGPFSATISAVSNAEPVVQGANRYSVGRQVNIPGAPVVLERPGDRAEILPMYYTPLPQQPVGQFNIYLENDTNNVRYLDEEGPGY